VTLNIFLYITLKSSEIWYTGRNIHILDDNRMDSNVSSYNLFGVTEEYHEIPQSG
jgi:hypothetical protein